MSTPVIPKGWRKLKVGEIRRKTDMAWTFPMDVRGYQDNRFQLPDSFDMQFVGRKYRGTADGDFFVIRKIARKQRKKK